MKTLNLFSILFVVCFMLGCESETPEPIRGCMDPMSTNYNPDAVEDDGSCAYQANISFWYNEAASKSLGLFGYDELSVYLNERLAGTMPTTMYSNINPGCGNEEVFTLTFDLSSDTTSTYNYSIENDNGDVFWKGKVELNPMEECKVLYLSFHN